MAKVSRVVVDRLKKAGIRHVFGIPSIHNIGLYDALRDEPSIRHILCRQEAGAAHMADGYARAGKGPGVVIASTGPGICYTAAPLLEALGSSSPVVVITSNIERKRIGAGCGALHEMRDQDDAFRGLVKARFCLRDAEDAAYLAKKAVETAVSGRPGPVYFEIPTDLWDKEVSEKGMDLDVSQPSGSGTDYRNDLERAAEILFEAERPLVITGSGALRAGLSPVVYEICNKLEAPLLTSAEGKGLVSEHEPFVFGNAARRGSVRKIIKSSDLVLALGTRLRHCDFSRRGVELPRLIHVDWDDSHINKNRVAEISVTGDIRKIARELAAVLKKRPVRQGERGWDIEALKAEAKKERLEIAENCLELVYVDALRCAMPSGGTLLIDNTILGYWAEYFYQALFPGSLVTAKGSSIIGFSFPAAAGLKLACPERPVAALIGDGGFFYCAQEISTCLRHRIGFPVIVVNDGSFGMIGLLQEQIYRRGAFEADFVNPDLQAFALSYGIASRRVQTPQALKDALCSAISSGKMELIELAATFRTNPFEHY